jgi:hypothetical protein
MRRLKDTPGAPGHLELLKLAPPERLFVQRWIELFDWAADIHFQHRPVALADAEAEERAAEGFHVPLLAAEVAALRAAPTFSRELVATNPILAAEGLAANPAARLHHPLYLFHAINILLDATGSSFEDRLGRIEQAWTTSADIDHRVYFRVSKLRALPAKRPDGRLRLLPVEGLPDTVRLVTDQWFGVPEMEAVAPVPAILEVTVRARDGNGALAARGKSEFFLNGDPRKMRKSRSD